MGFTRATSPRLLLPAAIAIGLVGSACFGPIDSEAEEVAPISVTESAAALPAFVRGHVGQFEDVSNMFGAQASQLMVTSSERDALGFTHERFSQTRNGLEVVGGDIRIARDENDVIVAASGASWSDQLVHSEASVAESTATDAALAATVGAKLAEPAVLVYVAPSSGAAPTLAWRTIVRGKNGEHPIIDVVFVDAISGVIVDRHPQIHTARNRQTYDALNVEIESLAEATLVRDEAAGLSGDTDIDGAHDAAGLTYDCVSSLFGRDSYDGAGASLVSIANYGVDYANAFWSDEAGVMVYGDNFAVIDVGTHEFVHAITSRSAGLIYQNESGALNEAMSDIVAAVCDANAAGSIDATTWQIGEDIPNIGPFRHMNNPTMDGQSTDHYATRFTGTEDNGGVHLNSGIANLAFVLAVEGGPHPRLGLAPGEQPVLAMGIDSAAQVFYRALTMYMNANTDFAGARAATEQAAVDLHGADSSEAITISEAWAAVGVGSPAPVRPEPEPEPEPEPNQDDDDDQGAPASGNNLEGGCSVSAPLGSGTLLPLLGLVLIGLIRRRRR